MKQQQDHEEKNAQRRRMPRGEWAAMIRAMVDALNGALSTKDLTTAVE